MEEEKDYSNKCPLAFDKNCCGKCQYGERVRSNEYVCHANDTEDEEMDRLRFLETE